MPKTNSSDRPGTEEWTDGMQMLRALADAHKAPASVQLAMLLQVGTTFFRAESGQLAQVQAEGYHVRCSYPHAPPADTLPLADTPLAGIVRQQTATAFPLTPDAEQAAFAGAPVYVKGKLWGVLSFSTHAPTKVFTSAEVELVQMLAHCAGHLLAEPSSPGPQQLYYQSLVEDSPALLGVHDSEGYLRYINKAVLQQLGYTPTQVIGQPLRSFIASPYAHEVEGYLERLRRHRTDRGVMTLLTQDGDLRHWSYRNQMKDDMVLCFAQDITEVIRTKKALKQSRQTFQEVQSMAKLGSWQFMLESQKFSYTEILCHLFELNSTSAHYRPEDFLARIHPADAAAFQAHVRQALHTHESLTHELRFTLPSGTTKHLEVHVRVVTNAQAHPVALVGTVQDITTESRIRQQLQDSERNLKEAQQVAKIGSWQYVLTAQGQPYWSEETYRIYRRDPQLGPPMLEEYLAMLPPATATQFREAMDRAVAHQEAYTIEHPVIFSDQETLWLKCIGRPITDASGKVVRLIGTVQDITETVEAHRKRQESEQNLKEAQELARIGSWEHDLVSHKVFWSEETYRLYGLEPRASAPSLEEFLQLIPPYTAQQLQALINRAIEHHEPYDFEYQIVLPDHSVRYLRSLARPVVDAQGRVVRLIGAVQDITATVEAHQEAVRGKELAEEAARIKQEFLAFMSHEIRTPMNAILGFARLLLQSELPTEQHQCAQSIYESAETLLVVINDVLDFSKIEAGKLAIEQIHFSPQKLLASLQRLFSVKVDKHYVRLLFQTDAQLPPALIGDPVRLTQILNNLLGNAIKFTEKGFVEVTTSVVSHQQDQYRLRFAIADSGIGISEEKLQTIFNSFEQAEGDTTRRFGGTGLGLTIVKRLLELMEGTIQVESQPGRGSTFSIELPFREGDVARIPSDDLLSGRLLPLEKLHGKTILLAEDNLNNQVLAQKYLLDAGCAVDIAENGRKVLYRVQHKVYDLILMDIQMPELDGLAATRAIRAMEAPVNAIPILAMTAHALREEERQYWEAGMTGYISKPFKPEALYIALLKAFDDEFAPTTPPEIPPPDAWAAAPRLDRIDSAGIDEYTRGSAELKSQMIQIFLRHVPALLAKMETALHTHDWKTFRQNAHTLKGSIGFFGMEHTSALLSELESDKPDPIDPASLEEQFRYLKQNCERAFAFFKGDEDPLRTPS
ncbi:PAS domain S-box-containing protein [Catalinimonas alkaloidigena]|uniref:histidine kinase n=1 Tax=Catalinimonas alkaloidigena TaxID=1075417 RepID=A0A1G9SXZ5_9BACT|nr:PAS domain-containing protein [Catalinimonas alkaloidigena]SDM40284.1 PAS domain S-box-containing protein [Catalinimonas alkaloidigena]